MDGLWCMGLFGIEVASPSYYFIRQQSDSAAPITEGKFPNLPGRGYLPTKGRFFFEIDFTSRSPDLLREKKIYKYKLSARIIPFSCLTKTKFLKQVMKTNLNSEIFWWPQYIWNCFLSFPPFLRWWQHKMRNIFCPLKLASWGSALGTALGDRNEIIFSWNNIFMKFFRKWRTFCCFFTVSVSSLASSKESPWHFHDGSGRATWRELNF